jgi:hypothetical protein
MCRINTTPPGCPFHHCSKSEGKQWKPANVGTSGYRSQPSGAVDNWAAAWKLRRHWEEETEKRKAAGKPVY